MLGAVTGDEVRGTAAGAGARRACPHGGRERRVARQAQVVVAAEVDELAAAGEPQHPARIGRETLHREALAPQVRRLQPRQRGA